MANEQVPRGPWDIPLERIVHSFPIVILIHDLKNNKMIEEKQIDYSDYESRKCLGRITFWAINNGYSVETLAAKDKELALGAD